MNTTTYWLAFVVVSSLIAYLWTKFEAHRLKAVSR